MAGIIGLLLTVSIFLYLSLKDKKNNINNLKIKLRNIEENLKEVKDELFLTREEKRLLEASSISDIRLIKKYIEKNNTIKEEKIKLNYELNPYKFIVEEFAIGRFKIPEEDELDLIRDVKYKNGKKYSCHISKKGRVSGWIGKGNDKNKQIRLINDGKYFLKSIFWNYGKDRVVKSIYVRDSFFYYDILGSIETPIWPEKIQVEYYKKNIGIKEVYDSNSYYEQVMIKQDVEDLSVLLGDDESVIKDYKEEKIVPKSDLNIFKGEINSLQFLLKKEDSSKVNENSTEEKKSVPYFKLQAKEYTSYDKKGNIIEIKEFILADLENDQKWDKEQLKSLTKFYYQDDLLILKNKYNFDSVGVYLYRDNIIELKDEYIEEFSDARIACDIIQYNYNSQNKISKEVIGFDEFWNLKDLNNHMQSATHVSFATSKNYIYNQKDFLNLIQKLKTKQLIAKQDISILYEIFLKYISNNTTVIIETCDIDEELNIYINEIETINS